MIFVLEATFLILNFEGRHLGKQKRFALIKKFKFNILDVALTNDVGRAI